MEITLIRGLSGSGKSTLADDIEKNVKKKRVKVQKISADFYFTDQNGNYKWDGKKLKFVHEKCHQRCEQLMKIKCNIIVDNTNITCKEMMPYVRLALQYGYKINLAEPNNPWSKDPVQCVERNIHGLDLEKIQKQKAKWEKTTVNKLISMANNRNEIIPKNCPKKKSPANKLPEKKNDTANIQSKQNVSKKSHNEVSKASTNIEQLASTLPSYLEKIEYLADLYNFDLLFNAEGARMHLRLVYPKSTIAKPLFVESFRAETKDQCIRQVLLSKRPELVLANDKSANKTKSKKSKTGKNIDDLTREFEIDLN